MIMCLPMYLPIHLTMYFVNVFVFAFVFGLVQLQRGGAWGCMGVHEGAWGCHEGAESISKTSCICCTLQQTWTTSSTRCHHHQPINKPVLISADASIDT